MNLATSFLTSSAWLGVMMFILAAVVAALACYGVVRTLLASRLAADSGTVAGTFIPRLGTLHALILALMFAQEVADYRDISRTAANKANVIADVYVALEHYDEIGPTSTAGIRELIVGYVKTGVEKGRAALAEGRLSDRAWIDYRRIGRVLRELKPINDDQANLQAEMVADWDSVSNFRLEMRAEATYESPDILWVVIITGFFAIVIPCYVYSPNIANLVTLGTFAALNGLVMYVVLALENPFNEPFAIDANVLSFLLESMMSRGQ